MINSICRKVTALLGAYIENKLTNTERKFVESHFVKCAGCRKKFYEMNKIIGSLHYEYEKMIKEFDKIEADKNSRTLCSPEFYKNISPYIDNELGLEDSIKFRKYILKSKQARSELENAYKLSSSIKKSAAGFMDKSNINVSRKVIKRLKNSNTDTKSGIYKRAAIIISFMLSLLAAIAVFAGLCYFNKSYAQIPKTQPEQGIVFPDDSDWIEFYFDDKGNFLFADK